jgi:nucleoside-diphosphate-sugar epimerase
MRQVHFVAGDIADQALFERTLVDNRITHVVHLAALQVPFVRADPVAGARVDVVGHAVVLESVKRHADQIQGLVYASSIGVYGRAERYPDAPLAHDAPLAPPNLYGVYKEANEGMARIYWEEYGLPSIGLRPYVLYGPGRDQGMTSTPTKAMLAAAVGRSYHISYGGRAVFQYAPDAADVFLRAARGDGHGAPVYNLGGSAASLEQIVAAIEATAPDSRGRITFEPASLPHPPEIDGAELDRALGPIPWTPLDVGVRTTIEHFRRAAETGRLNVERAIA